MLPIFNKNYNNNTNRLDHRVGDYNNRYSKNIVENYLSSGIIPGRYDRLNSIKEMRKDDTSAHESNHVRKKYSDANNNRIDQSDYLEFDVLIEEIGITVKRKIHILKNYENCNIISWLDEIDKLIEEKKWNDKQSKIPLKNIIVDETILKIIDEGSFVEIKKKILSHKYNLHKKFLIIEEIQKIYQNNYEEIEEYYKKITNKAYELEICDSMTKDEANKRFEEFFFLGLGNYTKMELFRPSKSTSKML